MSSREPGGRWSRAEIALVVLAGVAIFVLGSSVGWFVRGNWTAEWVAATGTWIGALGTIGAILWAAHTFRHQQDAELLARDQAEVDRRHQERLKAAQVYVTCRGGAGSGGNMTSMHLGLSNGTAQNVELLQFEVQGVRFQEVLDLPLIVAFDGWTRLMPVDPFHVDQSELSGRPFTSRHVTARYRVDGVEWERSPDEDPRRVLA